MKHDKKLSQNIPQKIPMGASGTWFPYCIGIQVSEMLDIVTAKLPHQNIAPMSPWFSRSWNKAHTLLCHNTVDKHVHNVTFNEIHYFEDSCETGHLPQMHLPQLKSWPKGAAHRKFFKSGPQVVTFALCSTELAWATPGSHCFAIAWFQCACKLKNLEWKKTS